MGNVSLQLLFLILLSTFLYFDTIKHGFCHDGGLNVSCNDTEKKALLDFKSSLLDPSGRLSSWRRLSKDCCRWSGVSCSTRTKHVIRLDLHNIPPFSYHFYRDTALGGKISSSLLDLKYLSYLDLSWNSFNATQIPKFFGSLKNLRYLNLSGASFYGPIPQSLGNLSNLEYLDLRYSSDPFVQSDIRWVSGLSSLKYLDLSGSNLTGTASYWLQTINTLPSLLELHLSMCNLPNLPPFLPSVNFTSLLVLDLSANNFDATIPQWLFNLSSLKHLDLSANQFQGVIPDAFSKLSALETLDLSSNYAVEGKLPRGLGNLCNLKVLGAKYMNLTGDMTDFIQSLLECSNNSLEMLYLQGNNLNGNLPKSLFFLKSLQSLDLSENSFTGSIPETIGNLSSLKELDLSENSFTGSLPETIGNLSSLKELDLSENSFKGSLPETIGNLSSLKELDLFENSFTGSLPETIGDLSSLKELDLSKNSFTGSIPETIGNLSSLKELDLYHNQMNGNIAENLGQLLSLVTLSLTENPWEGIITEAHLLNLSSLEDLSISTRFSPNISLAFNISSDWIPPFKLISIEIKSCGLGPEFPKWLKNQTELKIVMLNDVRISDTIPDWFIKLNLQLDALDLAHNQLRGKVSNSLRFISSAAVDLSSNLFEGPLPLLSSNVRKLLLNDNKFCGSIPLDIGIRMPGLVYLNISSNFLDGSLPMSLGNMRDLRLLTISNNRLSGELPSGLRNCNHMFTLDLGDNQLSGNLPAWIGETMPLLRILRVRNNSFTGSIPLQFCGLSLLHILDLSKNNLSGKIPPCVGNLTGFISEVEDYGNATSLQVVTKGSILLFTSTLKFFKSIDLSENDLSGEIPTNITSLSNLDTLNLSMNHLTGNIPSDIGNLKKLESLDLSINRLSGPIPASMASLTLLNHLNLSHNNLSGYIPTNNQFSTFNDPSIYTGNTALCGSPLQSRCGNETSIAGGDHGDMNHGNEGSEDDDALEKLKLFVVVGLGFFVGFWGVCGTLILRKHLRDAYFLFLLRMKDKICGVLRSS